MSGLRDPTIYRGLTLPYTGTEGKPLRVRVKSLRRAGKKKKGPN